MLDAEKELCETVREFCRESWREARHHEVQRSTVSGAIIAISAAVTGFITSHATTPSDLPLTLFLTIIGLFGAAFCAKHYERFQLHMEVIKEAQAYLDRLLPGEPLQNIFDTAQARHKKHFHMLRRARLNHFWIWLHLMVALLGLLLSIYVNAALFQDLAAREQTVFDYLATKVGR